MRVKFGFISLMPVVINKNINLDYHVDKNNISNLFCKYDYECELPNTCIIILADYGFCGYDKRKKLIPILVPIPIDNN